MPLFGALTFPGITTPKIILRAVYGIRPGKRLYMNAQSYIISVIVIAISRAIRYTRRVYAICTSNTYPMQSIDRVDLLLYRLHAISSYSMHIDAYIIPFYAST